MKKKKFVIGPVILLLIGGIVFWKFHSKSAGNGASESRIIQVTQGPIERTIETTGEVTPLNRVEIKPPISGRIEKLIADEGDRVTNGQILAWMSSSDRAAILDAARAKGPEEEKKWQDSYKATPIVAPLSGVIILRNIVVGQTIDASTVLYAMSDRLIIEAQVDEADIGQVKMGLPCRIVLDAYPDQNIDGKVFQILYEGKNVSNVITYGVKITPTQVPPFFRSQMTANVTLVLERHEDALMLPSDAIRGSGDSKRVMIPSADPKKEPEAREITTGIETGGQTEILSGLNAGDQVVMVHKKYTPQKGPQTSPLAGGNRSPQQQGSNRQGGGGSGQSRSGR